jgi:hypothetical protein
MPTSALATFAAVLSTFRAHFRAPTFVRFVILAVGWILASDSSGGVCVTEALVAAGVSGQMRWEAFHRFFSRATWRPDRLGQTLFGLLSPLMGSVVEVAIDDTVCRKRGRRVFGATMHVDAVTSTRQRRNLVRGHCWVELVVVVNVPWSTRAWSVAVLSRLYRGKKESAGAYRTKAVLGREMLDELLRWIPRTRKVHLLVDSGYMNRSMLKGLPLEQVTVFGSLKTNAALYRLRARPKSSCSKTSPSGGRRRKKGERLPTPARMQHDGRRAWKTLDYQVSQRTRSKQVLSLKVQWYGVLGERINHVVLVREDEVKLRVVLCTDATLSEGQVLEQGARRWPIEVWNRDVKQHFGFADSPAWSEKAVRRTAPWVALLSGVLVVWFHRTYQRGLSLPIPERPWYVSKQNISFADVLRAAQHTLRGVDVAAWADAIADERPEVFARARGEKRAYVSGEANVADAAKAA